MNKRLHIGAGRLENLPYNAKNIFMKKEWINLGDDEEKKLDIFKIKELLKNRSFIKLLLKIPQKISNNLKSGNNLHVDNFQKFFFQKGSKLQFPDESFSFIYSEHFFEHLFFDEALDLFKELYRVLTPNAVLRTVVPDADLRTYEPPEKAGTPDLKMPFTDPWEHKTRWNVYMLTEALNIAGFHTIPTVYCDKYKKFHNYLADISKLYSEKVLVDQEIVFDTSFIIRKKSLIVDGIKV